MDGKDIKILFVGVQSTLLGVFLLEFFGASHVFSPLSFLLVAFGILLTVYGVNR